MSKLVFTEKAGFNFISEGQSFISIGAGNVEPGVIGNLFIHNAANGINPIILGPGMILNMSSIYIETHGTLTSQTPIGEPNNVFLITAPENLHIDVQNGHSLCIAQNLAPVTVVLDGTLTLEDVTHSPIQVGMHAGSTINVIHTGNHYTFQNDANLALGNGGHVYIGDVNQFVTVCSTVNELVKNTTDTNPFPLEKVCFLRDYQKLDHSLVEAFMAQNKMLPVSYIDNFIAAHYFEFEAIAHLTASNFSKLMTETGDNILTESPLKFFGNYDPIQMICSYLDLEGVNYKYATLTGDNNQNPDGGAA